MKISSEQLQQPSHQLLPVYFITGDEALLVEESGDFVRQIARENGFEQRQIFHVDSKFDWSVFHHASRSLSLFSEKEIIELRIPTGKPSDAGKKALLSYLEHPPKDKLLLIISRKVTGAVLNTKWLKALAKVGAVVQIWPIDPHRLPQWLKKRANQMDLNLSQDAIQFIVEQTEGNLLAAKQHLDKLHLIYGEQPVTLNAVVETVSDAARYDVYQLADAVLKGDSKQSLRILARLKEEGVEPTIILWALVREIRTLMTLIDTIKKGISVDQALKKQFIFEKRKPYYRGALTRLNLLAVEQALSLSAEVDQAIKGLVRLNSWHLFERLILLMTAQHKVY